MAKEKPLGAFPEYIDPVEARVINKLITKMLETGGEVRVRCFEDPTDVLVPWTRNRKGIQSETAATDGTLYDFRPASGLTLGTVVLIHGNGEDVISDFSARDDEKLNELENLFGDISDYEDDPLGAWHGRNE